MEAFIPQSDNVEQKSDNDQRLDSADHKSDKSSKSEEDEGWTLHFSKVASEVSLFDNLPMSLLWMNCFAHLVQANAKSCV